MTHTQDELIRILSDIEPTPEMYSSITASDVPQLNKLLGSDEGWLAARAVFALSRVGGAEAFAALKNAAKMPRSEVRVALAASAVDLPHPQADPLLATLLRDDDEGVVKFAIASVRRDSGPSVRRALEGLATKRLPAPLLQAAREKLARFEKLANVGP